MMIIRFTIKNFRGIVELAATPEGRSLTLRGRNGTGKSNAVDALWWGLGGAPDGEVVRNGADQVETEIVFDQYLVVRRKSRGKPPRLTVRSADGKATYASPAALLAGFLGAIDRRTFTTRPAREQADIVRRLAPELDVSDLETRRSALYEERTAIGREADQLEARARGVEMPPPPPEPGEERSIAELVRRQREAAERLRANERAREQLAAAERAAQQDRAELARLRAELEEAVLAPEGARRQLEERDRLRAASHAADTAAREAEARVAELEQQLAQARRVAWTAQATAHAAADRLVAHPVPDLDRLEARPIALRGQLERAAAAADTRAQALTAAQSRVAELRDPDLEALEHELAGAEDHNRAVRERRRVCDQHQALIDSQRELAARAAAARAQYEQRTGAIAEIDREKLARIAGAALPIPGLALAGDVVTYDDGQHGPVEARLGVLNDAACGRLDVAMAAALGHRVVRLSNAERFDRATRTEIDRLATERGIQLLAEVVTEGEQLEAVIEGGAVPAVPALEEDVAADF